MILSLEPPPPKKKKRDKRRVGVHFSWAKGMTAIFGNVISALLTVVHQNKGLFWNPETKLDQIGMYQNENLTLKYDLFDLTTGRM